MKHHVRVNGWLPACKRRLDELRARAGGRSRRLRYFTFCATDAVDVLMLHVAKVVRTSSQGTFDTVVFFNRDVDSVGETRKSIPGSYGFPGDFVKAVLAEDPDQGATVPADGTDIGSDELDTFETRQEMRLLAIHRDFRKSFPFDVINIDIERYPFRPKEPVPGDVIRAFRRVFDWQKKVVDGGQGRNIDAFVLMFSTRVGPSNLGEEFVEMLTGAVQRNIDENGDVRTAFVNRTGVDEAAALCNADFELFFKLATPKVIVETLRECDWYVDPQQGISVFEYERKPAGVDSYRMMHLVMDVKRQAPPLEMRAPGGGSAPGVKEAHVEVIRRLFEFEGEKVSEDGVDRKKLENNLASIEKRRSTYLAGR